MRNHKIIELTWLDENEFICIFERTMMGQTYKIAGYGWSKGGSFMVYTIGDGHISRLGGMVKRMDLEVAFPPPVW